MFDERSFRIGQQIAQLNEYRNRMAMLDHARRSNRRRVYLTMAVALLAVLACALLAVTHAAEPDARASRWMNAIATAYCAGPCETCGTIGITKTGRDAHSRGVATDPALLGARLDVPGYGVWIRADDTGHPDHIYGNRIDVRFDTHDQAKAWGRKIVRVRVWE